MVETLTEAIETCPHCCGENSYPNYDVKASGYVAICQHCREQIFLCDECLHADDNEERRCDWHGTETGGECFRGKTILKEVIKANEQTTTSV